ncbi:MAG TPA: hypothetical protein PKD64_11785 [Pirellulaceae bacterium]|nr:hypothetical protein [Pirellulaceae bacterium]HMO92865.1 hypothetical protein [Pirellulaceae bacterium]HMP71102.1 hypothetical protein [Pirellulaceae bacterium]
MDTICNTFGGILLVALLVVVMLLETSRTKNLMPPTLMTLLEMAKIDNYREELTRELVTLREATKQIESNLEQIPDEVKELFEKLSRNQAVVTELKIQESDVLGMLNQTQISINNMLLDEEARKREYDETRMYLTELRSRVDASLNEAATDLTIRSVTSGSKDQLSYILKDGKLYGPIRYVNGKLNTLDFQFVERDNQTYIEPKLNAGEVIPDQLFSSASITAKFAEIKSSVYDIRIFVYSNSFGRYAQVEDVIRKLGFKIDLYLMSPDEAVIFKSDTRKRVG